MKRFLAFLPHLTLSVALATLTILIIDMFINEAMGFVLSIQFKWLCLILCLLSYAVAIVLIAENRSSKK